MEVTIDGNDNVTITGNRTVIISGGRGIPGADGQDAPERQILVFRCVVDEVEAFSDYAEIINTTGESFTLDTEGFLFSENEESIYINTKMYFDKICTTDVILSVTSKITHNGNALKLNMTVSGRYIILLEFIEINEAVIP